MNPATPLNPVVGMRVPAGNGDRQRRNPAHDAFRRALQDDGTPRDPAGDVPDPPKPSRLQPKPPASRNNQSGQAHHIDVVV